MKAKAPTLKPADIIDKLMDMLQQARRYSVLIFIVFVGLVYGFVFFKVNSLSNKQPSTDAVTSQVKAARLPHIDQSVVDQLQSLRDNSVSVRTLFNQARNNPFQ